MQPFLSINFSGFDQVIGKLDQTAELLTHLDAKHPAFTDALSRIGEQVTKAVKERTPVRTGKLRDSIRWWVQPGEAIVETTVPYAKFLEFGTRAHGPKTKKALRFKDSGGKWVYAKWVKGIQPRNMFKGGVDASQQFISQALHDALYLIFL